ncbi:MAG: cyclic nucleotide-binding domain-containing protein [Caldilineaceae bacterium]
MSNPTRQVDPFNQQLQTALYQATRQNPGSGWPKVPTFTCLVIRTARSTLSTAGRSLSHAHTGWRECLLAILTDGDIFGELCLAGLGERQETAIAMTTAVVRFLPCTHLALLSREGLPLGFIHSGHAHR